VQQNADAIELDAKLSADGYVVVIHDQTVDRTTSGIGRVRDISLSDLQALDAGSYFDPNYKGEYIPPLDEVLSLLGEQIFINIELTNYTSIYDDLPYKVAQLVEFHKLEENVLFSSFNPIALRRIHRILPEVPIGLLALQGPKGWWARSYPGKMLVPYQALHVEFRDTSTSLIEWVRKSGKRIHVYTVNNAKDLRQLFELRVDGIFTDDVPLANSLLENIQYS
jgi:glycerophosphoryl diester phosphodiesterase